MRRILLGLALSLWAFAAQAVVPQTRVGDAAYTVLSTDQYIVTTTAFTAARTWTLPTAGASCVGQTCTPAANDLIIDDVAGAITSTNTLTIAVASGDTINGNAANLIITGSGARIKLRPTSGNNWQSEIINDTVTATVATGSAVSLTTATAADIVTQSLSQGTYVCRGVVARNLGASTSVTKLTAGIGTTTNTVAADGTMNTNYFITAANVMTAGTDTIVGPVRVTLTSTTTLRLVAQDTFTVSTDAAYGQLVCDRVR